MLLKRKELKTVVEGIEVIHAREIERLMRKTGNKIREIAKIGIIKIRETIGIGLTIKIRMMGKIMTESMNLIATEEMKGPRLNLLKQVQSLKT